MQNYYFDSHVHTDNSRKGKHNITFLCETAINKGLAGFCVTDHFPCDQSSSVLETTMKHSVMDVRRAQVAFYRDLTITSGIELGQPLYNKEACEEILKAAPYDFVLGALHRDKQHQSYREIDFGSLSSEEIDQCLSSYYQEMLEMVEWGGFDVLAHITFPLSRIEGAYRKTVNMNAYAEIIRQILKTLAERGRGLELNTSGLRTDYGKYMPVQKYLKWFLELGGEIVTLGSDAYEANELGEGIADGMDLLRQTGYKYFSVYRNRQPSMVELG